MTLLRILVPFFLFLSLHLFVIDAVPRDRDKRMAPKEKRLGLNVEHRLARNLLKARDPLENLYLPVNGTDTIKVEMDLIAVTSYELTWQNGRLQWNPDDYEGLLGTRFLYSFMWRPDITLYNSAGSPLVMSPKFADTTATVLSTGKVFFMPHVSLKVQCPMDLTNFPWDTQQCHFRFGSWSYDALKLDLDYSRTPKNMYSSYNESFSPNEWRIQRTSPKKNIRKYACCEEQYVDVTYTIELKRNASNFVYCGPAILLAFMTPLVFLVPHGTGDKTSLCFCLLLCLLILIASLENYLRVTNMPLLLYYYAYSFLLVGISFIITILINNILDGCETAPPSVVFQTFSGLGKFMCMNTSSDKRDMIALVDSDSSSSVPQNGTSVRAKWRYIAKVIDRILCLVFLVVVVILTTAFFAK